MLSDGDADEDDHALMLNTDDDILEAEADADVDADTGGREMIDEESCAHGEVAAILELGEGSRGSGRSHDGISDKDSPPVA